MKYYIADLHLDHANIIRLCNRPFETIGEMNATIIEKWNKRVTDKDEVYVLGDFSWAKGEQTNKFLDQLNGYKYLIRGNHDYFLDDKDFDRSKFRWIKDYEVIKDEGYNIVLFPEKDESVYHRHLKDFYSGFVHLARKYFKENGKALLFYPVYIDKEIRKISMGKPAVYNPYSIFKSERDRLADTLMEAIRQLADRNQ
jgi:calcineurin-like phosphoesterase family protein